VNRAGPQSAVGHFLLALTIFFTADAEKSHLVNTASHCAFVVVLVAGIVEIAVVSIDFFPPHLDGCDTDVQKVMGTLITFFTARNGAVLATRICVAGITGVFFLVQSVKRMSRVWKKGTEDRSESGANNGDVDIGMVEAGGTATTA
jgi:hypothetical protein